MSHGLENAKLKILNIAILTISDFSVSTEAFQHPYRLNPIDDISYVLLLLLLKMMSLSLSLFCSYISEEIQDLE